jgi:hypothetical protein
MTKRNGDDGLPACVFRHLHEQQAFQRLLFADGSLNEDDLYFHRTGDAKEILTRIDRTVREDLKAQRRRIVGVRSHIGDGKSTLLGYLAKKHVDEVPATNVVTINLPGLEGGEENLNLIVRDLVWFLLYELRKRDLLIKDVYEDAERAFEETDDNPSQALGSVREFLRRVSPVLKKRYLVWVCDDVQNRVCLEAFRSLIDLKDSKPPKKRFFEGVPCLIVFATSRKEVEEVWRKNPNLERAGHQLNWLRVGASDVLEIVRTRLRASFRSIDKELAGDLEKEVETNPFYPFRQQDLQFFLEQKDKPERIERQRNDFAAEVAELNLHNMLGVLQRVIDKRVKEADWGLVRHLDLSVADNKRR